MCHPHGLEKLDMRILLMLRACVEITLMSGGELLIMNRFTLDKVLTSLFFYFSFLSDIDWTDSILSSMRKGACGDAESIFSGSNPVILAR
jgi:hypothetical protein